LNSGCYYYGSTNDIRQRHAQHARGHTSTAAKDAPWKLIASFVFETMQQARAQEHTFKRWKNPRRVFAWFER
jgi:predicted GIY-YIG superfamily endonuclease